MIIAVQDNPDRTRYELSEDGAVAGFLDYQLGTNVIALTHTEVGEQFGGRGLARTLVEETLADIRKRELSVLPTCSYVRKVIADDPDKWLDLVAADDREKFDLPAAD